MWTVKVNARSFMEGVQNHATPIYATSRGRDVCKQLGHELEVILNLSGTQISPNEIGRDARVAIDIAGGVTRARFPPLAAETPCWRIEPG